MKKLINRSLILVMMFTSVLSNSNATTLLPSDTSVYFTTVSIDSVDKGSLIQIKDKNGFILYSESVEESGTFAKKFDFTNLPEAEYYFELENKKEIQVRPFTVKSNSIEFTGHNYYKIVKPEVIVKGNNVFIQKTSEEKQTWEIEVYYKGYDLAYREKFKDVQVLNRVFDFSGSEKGEYTIVFESEGRKIENSVNIE